MKQFVIVLLATLTGALVALFVYDRLVLAPRAQAQAQAAAQVREIELSRADQQVQQIASELDASVERSVDDARDAMNDLANENDRRRLANEALMRASMLKVSLAEYYMTQGQWPANAAEAGLGAAETYAGGAVAGIDVGDGGRIAIRLNDTLAGGRIQLSPTVNQGGGMIQWRCTAQGADLARLIPACRD